MLKTTGSLEKTTFKELVVDDGEVIRFGVGNSGGESF